MRTVADQFPSTLAAADVKRSYGIAGGRLGGFTDAIRRQGPHRLAMPLSITLEMGKASRSTLSGQSGTAGVMRSSASPGSIFGAEHLDAA